MLTEPPRPRAPRLPDKGWPPLVDRVELTADMEISEASYWLAWRSREQFHGVVASFKGRQLYAWPHQTLEEVIQTYVRLGVLADELGTMRRWTPQRRLELLRMIRLNLVERASAVAEFELSDEELSGWDRQYAPNADAPMRTRIAGAP